MLNRYNSKCVTEKKSKCRKIHVIKHYDMLKERREKQSEKEFKEEMKVRAQIESTICELVRKHGLRKAKYKSEKGRQLQFYLSDSALNVKRLIRLINKGGENSVIYKKI